MVHVLLVSAVFNMTNVNLKFSSTLAPSDPSLNPVLIVGQLKNLTRLTFEDVKVKLQNRVSEEVLYDNFVCVIYALLDLLMSLGQTTHQKI